MREHWFVVGASSAIARAFIRAVAAEGADVTLAGRDAEDLEATASDAAQRGAKKARVVNCDITDPESITQCITLINQDDAMLNVLIAAGTMPPQVDAEADRTLVRKMIDTNYVGPVELTQTLIPIFERQGGGAIVIIGSVAGDRGRKSNYLYGSTKAALAAYAEGLRARLFKCGATVTLIKPGFVDTAMTWGQPGLFLIASPQLVGRAILRAARRGRSTVYVPWFWRYVMMVISHIPGVVMKRLDF